MKKHSENGCKSLKPLLDKDKRIIQEKKVFECFFASPKTMKEVDIESGIMRESICRYVGNFRRQGKIVVIQKRYCRITGHLAGELTTNPALFQQRFKQLDLFFEGGGELC